MLDPALFPEAFAGDGVSAQAVGVQMSLAGGGGRSTLVQGTAAGLVGDQASSAVSVDSRDFAQQQRRDTGVLVAEISWYEMRQCFV